MINRYRPATILDRYRIDARAFYHRPCVGRVETAELFEYGGGRGWRCYACGTSWQFRTFALFNGEEVAERFVVRLRDDPADSYDRLVWRDEGKNRFVVTLAPGDVARDGDVPFSVEPRG